MLNYIELVFQKLRKIFKAPKGSKNLERLVDCNMTLRMCVTEMKINISMRECMRLIPYLFCICTRCHRTWFLNTKNEWNTLSTILPGFFLINRLDRIRGTFLRLWKHGKGLLRRWLKLRNSGHDLKLGRTVGRSFTHNKNNLSYNGNASRQR